MKLPVRNNAIDVCWREEHYKFPVDDDFAENSRGNKENVGEESVLSRRDFLLAKWEWGIDSKLLNGEGACGLLQRGVMWTEYKDVPFDILVCKSIKFRHKNL